jgi:hypothetical protein
LRNPEYLEILLNGQPDFAIIELKSLNADRKECR